MGVPKISNHQHQWKGSPAGHEPSSAASINVVQLGRINCLIDLPLYLPPLYLNVSYPIPSYLIPCLIPSICTDTGIMCIYIYIYIQNTCIYIYTYIWLVVSTHLKNMSSSISINYFQLNGKIIQSCSSHHQPENVYNIHIYINIYTPYIAYYIRIYIYI